MGLPLEAWQERLERHFTDLAASRAKSGFPIFALEHGLSGGELADIGDQLRSRLAAGLKLGPHWLVWVVYATEQGYGYDGHEYWVSFEENTPRWRDYAGATTLRVFFSKFQQTYQGVVPTGRWAGWFRNIALPITHAILPHYLQTQFARALYDARHQLARAPSLTPAAAGELLASNACNASSRFREFLEQEELAGRIVLALLDQGTVHGQSPIYPATLARIVADLEEVRRAGEWLKEARRVVADRFHGVDRSGGFPARPGGGGPDESTTSPPIVRPTLLLRPTSGTRWSAIVEIPNFGGVAQLNAMLTAFLKNTRCRLVTVSDAPFPRAWLLAGPHRRVLKSWPDPAAPLINFEDRLAVLDNIMQRECRISSGPSWLFRVGSDGLAREITGHLVRPGQRYVLLSRESPHTDAEFVSACAVDCAGVGAVSFIVPEAVTVEQTNQLRKLGVEVARNIRMWPAGLTIRDWDGEGHGTWLTTETPCFGVVHDYPVDEYTLRLDNGPETTVEGQRAGQAVFVRLGQLPPGRHTLAVKARRIGVVIGSQALKDLEGSIELKVRDPAPWIPGTTSHSGLALSLDPPDPSLDALWEGNIALSLLGPDGRSVGCSISLTRGNGASLLEQEIGAFDLPITPATWLSRFKRFANDDDRAWKYLEASSGVLVIDGDELGRYSLPLEREGRPVRWVCRSASRTTSVRLIDDSGQDEAVNVCFFPFRHPTQPRSLAGDSALVGLVADEPGGLFVATHGDHSDALVVSSSHGVLGLQDLRIEPELGVLDASEPELRSLLDLIELWHGARLAGPIADSRREYIVRCLLAHLYGHLCGSRWSKAEADFLASSRSGANAQQLEKAVGGLPGFAVILRRDHEKADPGAESTAQWFSDIAARYAVTTDAPLCAFALRVAMWPFGLKIVFSGQFDDLLARLRLHPTLLRGARLVALLTGAAGGDAAMSTLRPGWA